MQTWFLAAKFSACGVMALIYVLTMTNAIVKFPPYAVLVVEAVLAVTDAVCWVLAYLLCTDALNKIRRSKSKAADGDSAEAQTARSNVHHRMMAFQGVAYGGYYMASLVFHMMALFGAIVLVVDFGDGTPSLFGSPATQVASSADVYVAYRSLLAYAALGNTWLFVAGFSVAKLMWLLAWLNNARLSSNGVTYVSVDPAHQHREKTSSHGDKHHHGGAIAIGDNSIDTNVASIVASNMRM